MNKSFPVLIAVFGLLGVALADVRPFEWKFIASTDKRLPRRVEAYKVFKSFEFNTEQLRAIIMSPELLRVKLESLKKEQFDLLPRFSVPTSDGKSTEIRILESPYNVPENVKELFAIPNDYFAVAQRPIVRTAWCNFGTPGLATQVWSFDIATRSEGSTLRSKVVFDWNSGTGYSYQIQRKEVRK
jgi:hypothetical protein